MNICFSAQSLNEETESRLTRCVIDLNSVAIVIGVEVTSPSTLTDTSRLQCSPAPTTESGSALGCSYDPDADMLYIRLIDDRSVDQESRNCKFVNGSDGRLLRIEIDQIDSERESPFAK